MKYLRYTARINFHQQTLKTIPGDDLDKLIAKLINLIETDYHDAIGEIVDNRTGEIVQKCHKCPPE